MITMLPKLININALEDFMYFNNVGEKTSNILSSMSTEVSPTERDSLAGLEANDSITLTQIDE